jgi:hypothetical protein
MCLVICLLSARVIGFMKVFIINGIARGRIMKIGSDATVRETGLACRGLTSCTSTLLRTESLGVSLELA